MKRDRRGSWYLLTGAVLGIAMGLIYSWIVSPVEYVDAPPYALRADYKDQYRVLIAEAYLYSKDTLRAVDRLKELRDHNVSQSLAMQAQQALAEGRPEGEIKALSQLALVLGEGLTPGAPGEQPASKASETPGNAPATPMPSGIPSQSPQQNPAQDGITGTPGLMNALQFTNTSNQTATQGAPFELAETTLVCNPDQPLPLIQVKIIDGAGQGVPGMEIVVAWDAGEDHFYTGLKPELGLGYADFAMTPGIKYSLRLAGENQAARDITIAECASEDGSQYWGSWLYTFTQP